MIRLQAGFIRSLRRASPFWLKEMCVPFRLVIRVSSQSFPHDLQSRFPMKFAILAIWSLAVAQATAAIRTWDGGDLLNTNWNDSTNWTSNLVPVAGDSLVFPSIANASDKATVNNFVAGTDFAGLEFTASGYSVTGNSFDLVSGGILLSYASGTTTISPTIVLTGTGQSFHTGSEKPQLTTGAVVLNGNNLTLNGVGTVVIGGQIANSIGTPTVTKLGSGNAVLSGFNNSPFNVNVSAGALYADGFFAGNGTITVGSGGTLAGTDGGIVKPTTVAGTVSPGTTDDITTTLEFDSLSFVSGTGTKTLDLDIRGTAAGDSHDRINISSGGSIALNSATLALDFDTYIPPINTVFTLINAGTGVSINGTFSGISQGASVVNGGQLLQFSYVGGTGNDFTATVLNQAPIANNQSVSTNEDTAVPVTLTGFDANGQSLTYSLLSSPSNGSLSGTGANRTYTPNSNFNGTDSFTFRVSDGSLNSSSATVSITVNPVNDVPTLNTIANPAAINEDTGLRTISLTGIGSGASNESQTLTVTATSNNTAIIPHPVVTYTSPNTTGSLAYTPVADANGSAVITVTVNDGQASNNIVTRTFTVNVTAVNDTPTLDAISNPAAINEDSGIQTIDLTGIGTGAANESQTLVITATSNNPSLIPNPSVSYTSPGAVGTLSFTPVANASGSAVIFVTVDDGQIVNNFLSRSFTVTVNTVNDVPSFTKGADVVVNEDAGAYSVTGWATALSPGPANEAAQTLQFLVGNDNAGLFSAAPAVTSNGTLTFTPATNAFGVANVTVQIRDNGGTANGGVDTSVAQTFVITVAGVNDMPSFTASSPTVSEDAGPQVLTGWATPNAGQLETQSVAYAVMSNSNPGLFTVQPSVAADGSLTFTAAPDANGAAVIGVQIQDDGGTANGGVDTSAVQNFTITVTGVNDTPSFVKGADQILFEGAGAQTVVGWASSISPGPVNEAGQVIQFQITGNTNPSLFLAVPAVSTSGNLTFTAFANAVGSATITLRVRDNGGTAGGGSDASLEETFDITITGVNDAPSFALGANQILLEDAGAQVVPGWATSITAGPIDEADQTLEFIVTSEDPSLFAVQPTISADGTLSYTPAADAFGLTNVSVRLHDDGGAANGGIDMSPIQITTIMIIGINDAPSFEKGSDQVVLEDSGAHTISGWATNLSAGPGEQSQALTFEIIGNSNESLFVSGPTVDASGNLSFQTALNANGSAVISMHLRDSGNTLNGGVNVSEVQNLVITVTAVNDRPTFAGGGSQSAFEDAGPQEVAGWAENMNPGPADEAGQSVQFVVVSNSNPGLFSEEPEISADGTLTWTPAPDAHGVASIGVQLADDGGTENEGLDRTVTISFQIQVVSLNDAPTFVKGSDITVLEDAGNQVIPGWATSISAGAANESSQTLTFTVIGTSGTLTFLHPPSLAADGTLSFTTSENAIGSMTFQMHLFDGEAFSESQTFIITATPVNDAPSFFINSNQSHSEGTQLRTVNGWLSSISVGPPDEVAQTRSFEIVSNSNPSLFGTLPSINSSGTLTYSIGFGKNGTAIIGVRMRDSGGTEDGGVDVSATQNLVIHVTSSNNQPTFTGGPSVVVDEDAGPQSIPLWATNVSPGPPDESGQIITFLITLNTAPTLFSEGPAVSADGTLTFTAAANAHGIAQLAVVAKDSGGNNPGIDTSPSHSFTITVNALNDLPVAQPQSLIVPKNARLPVTLTSTDIEGNPMTLSIVTPPAHGTVSEFNSPSGPLGPMNLIYTPDAGYTGTDSFTYRATDADPGLPATVDITITEPPVATGVTRVWDGGAGTLFWADAANWSGDEVPQPGDSLSFPDGATGVANTSNNLPARFVFDEIFLHANQTVSGNALALLGGIESAKGVNWNAPLDFIAPGYLRALPSGGGSSFLTLHGEINLGPFSLDLEASGATLSTRNRILGTGGVTTAGNVNMENISAIAGVFTGGVTVESGSLRLIRQIIGQRTVAAGPVEVKSGAVLTIDSFVAQATFNPLDENSTLTLREGAALIVDGHAGTTQRISSLFTEGGIVSVSSANTLRISGDITVSGLVPSTMGTGSPNASIVFDGAASEHAIHVATDSRLSVNSHSLIFAEALVRKTGDGALELNGRTQFTGGLSVDEGLVRFFADLNPGAIGTDAQLTPIVLNGGSVSGRSFAGSFARRTGPITSGTGGGILSPDTDFSELRTLSLALNPATTFRTVFQDSLFPNDPHYDLTFVQGTIDLGGAAFELVRPSGFVPPAGDAIVIIENDGTDPIIGTFAGMPEGQITTIGNVTYQISYEGGDGNDVSLLFNVLPTGTTRVWDGGGDNNNWSEASNWVGDIAPEMGDTLEFPSPSPRMTPINDYPINTSFHQLRIVGDGPRYEMNGNPLTLSGGVFTSGSLSPFFVDVVLMQIRMVADQSIVKAGTRRFFGSGWNTSGHVLTLNDQVAGFEPVNTANTGIGVTIAGTGDLIIEGAGSCTASHGLPVHSGTVEVRSGTVVISGMTGNHRTGPMIVGGFGQSARLLTVGSVAQLETVPTIIRSQGLWEHVSFAPSFPIVFQPVGNVTLDGGSMIAGLNARFDLNGTVTVQAGSTASWMGEFKAAASGGGPVSIEVQAGAMLNHLDPAGQVSSNSGSYFVKTGSGLWHSLGSVTAPRIDLVGGVTRMDGVADSTLIQLLGGTLAGSGSVGNITSVGSGHVAPGASAGILGSGDLSWSSTTDFEVEIGGVIPGSGYDQLAVTGSVNLGGASLEIQRINGFAPSSGDVFTLIENDGADGISGTFDGLPESSVFSAAGTEWLITYQGGSGNDVVITCQTVASAIETWRQLNFGTTANSGDAANDFDFDKDGLVNLIEFAFGLDPKSNSAHLMPQAQRVGNELVITFTPPPGVSGVIYGAEASATMAVDDWEPVPDTGIAPVMEFRIAIEPGTSKFMRLTVSDP